MAYQSAEECAKFIISTDIPYHLYIPREMTDHSEENGLETGNSVHHIISGTATADEKSFQRESTNSRENGFLFKIRHETEFRLRFMHTAFVWWGFVTLGWMVALSGTGFPDIRLIINEDLETASWLFTAGALGYMIGAFVGGLIFDRINRLLMLTIVITLMAVTLAAIPWCSNFPLMLVVNTLNAVFSGGLDVGGNSHIASICGADAGPYMHSIHFGFSIGGILSPLIAEPFLATKTCRTTNQHNSTNVSLSTVASISTTTEECDEDDEIYGETKVHYAYLIGGVLVLSAAIPFLVVYCSSGRYSRNNIKEKPNEKVEESSSSDLPVLSLKLKIVFVAFLSTFLMCYCAVENRFSSLLMTFVVEQLDWTKSDGARVNTVFWAAFAAGRFLGIIITRYVKPKLMLAIYLCALGATFAGFMVASMFEITWLIWVLTAVAGLAMSIIFPSIFTWTAESILPVTGTISGIYLLNVSAGNMLLPLLYGHLMDKFTRLWFSYLLVAQCIGCIVLYVIILLLVKKYITPFKKRSKNQTAYM